MDNPYESPETRSRPFHAAPKPGIAVWVSTGIIFLGSALVILLATVAPLACLEDGLEIVVVVCVVMALGIAACAALAYGQYMAVFKRSRAAALTIGSLFLLFGTIGVFGAVHGVLGLLGYVPVNPEYDRWEEVWIPLGVFLSWIGIGLTMLRWFVRLQSYQARRRPR